MPSEPTETTWRPGDVIDKKWEVHGVLHGGMGIVYVVYDREARQPLAVKTFRDDVFAQNPDIAERFRNEARSWIELDRHENVVRAHFLQIVRGLPLLFLEYVGGGDLSQWIGSPRLTENPKRVLTFAIQFCDGMCHVIEKGIKVHRDIKPGNCLISENETLKIADFGLAKVFDNLLRWVVPESHTNRGPAVTQTGLGGGTPTHMSPEQFVDAKRADTRSDIYSFGVLLFEMVTGKLPFIGSTVEELEYLHKRQPPPHLPPQWMDDLDGLVALCLAKNPSDRIPTFAAVRQQLVKIYELRFGERAPKARSGDQLTLEDLNNKAISIVKLGRNEEALACINEALQLNGRDTLSWLNKAFILIEMGRYKEAIECCDKALHIDSKEPRVWWNKGLALASAGRAEEAICCYDVALGLDPLEGKMWTNKGTALASLGKLKEAITCYERAVSLNSADDKAWVNLGNALARLERYQDAIPCYERAIDLNRYEPKYKLLEAHVLAQSERYKEALFAVDQALELDSSNARAWFMKGVLLGTAFNHHDEAIGCLEEASRLGAHEAADSLVNMREALERARKLGIEALHNVGPKEAAMFNEGYRLFQSRRYLEAASFFEKALNINPRYEQAWCNEGRSLRMIGHDVDALACYTTAVKLDSNDSVAWLNMGALLASLGRIEEALDCWDRTIRLNPRHEEAWCNKGIAIKQLGHDNEAIRCLDHAISIRDTDDLAWFNRAFVLSRLDRGEEALASYDRALALNPQNVSAWFNKGVELVNRFQKYSDALPCFEAAARLGHAQGHEAVAQCRKQLTSSQS